ncbi:PEP-CTERM sorting domain-containing protein [uncultured Massilia sp.]|uniref:PEP-CTERM sorting domain-containing protein n=1 Tax=uncultured Massilia sp. TaxID=169973 RepID=UPI0025DB02F1|nr:PEP-CTERM sorting domain-containing protein [uncultured Massilia sp.]
MQHLPALLAVAGALAMPAGPAHSDTLPFVTFTSTGTITRGDDYIDYFHNGGVLIGQQFTMSLTVDVSTLSLFPSNPDAVVYGNATDTAVSWGELTINGRTFSWANDQSSSYVIKRNPADAGHGASIDTWGIANDGISVYASTDIRSLYNRFLPDRDITQPVVFDMGAPYMEGETYVSVNGGTQGFDFSATRLASAAWTVSAVPEPGSYAMLAAGLAVAGLARRRKR